MKLRLINLAFLAAACGAETNGSTVLDDLAQEPQARSRFLTGQCTLIKHDVRQDGTIVSQYYELIDAGSDPTKVWVYAVGENSSLNCGSDRDLVNCGASLDKNILTYHFQPTLYADGIAVVECGEQFRLPDDTVVDRRKFLSFEVEIKP